MIFFSIVYSWKIRYILESTDYEASLEQRYKKAAFLGYAQENSACLFGTYVQSEKYKETQQCICKSIFS